MPQGHRRQGDDAMGRALGEGVRQARALAEGEVTALHERFGLSDVFEVAGESSKRGDFETAFDAVRAVRAVTSEAVAFFAERGYEVRDVGREYERRLGDSQFREAEAITPDMAPADLVDTVLSESGRAWDRLRSSVGSQAETGSAEMISNPKPVWSLGDAVLSELTHTWDKTSDAMISGGRVEDLRSGLGLRTLAALQARYSNLDARGSADALPRAEAWAHRAYSLTKLSVDHLIRRHEGSPAEDALKGVGAAYEGWLGDAFLGAPGASEISQTDSPWDVIRTTVRCTSTAWNGDGQRGFNGIKDIIPRS
ncbi:MAG: hypothetical protein GF416_08625 [Candidatus Altiarchaeales archaeon]|nr:hypothetical protein [Candidatus Altiarchaeales archaeon]MBD3417180.1 hypothetical protein [Candidatus Altiarchaeales archaeon]